MSDKNDLSMDSKNSSQNNSLNEFVKELFQILDEQIIAKDELAKLKIELCRKYGLKKIPTDIELLMISPNELSEQVKRQLLTKPNRSLSGVSPVAIMTSPAYCPHGKCTMCPGGIDSVYGDVPQSYTGREPATMRGMRAKYDSYLQVFNRLEQYIVTGHNVDKIDLIVMGGTFTAREKEYQEEFVGFAFKAMNDFSKLFFLNGVLQIDIFKEFFELPGDIGTDERTERIHKKELLLKGLFKDLDLEKEKHDNETTHVRCIGLTIETKPDWAFEKHCDEMLRLGCTRVELGVQTVYNDALQKVNRGHTTDDSIKAIRILKNYGFKINYHIMLGLPGIDREKDLKGLKELFDNPDYKPDMVKIYPCMVMPGTALETQWKQGLFKPITTDESAELISDFFRFVPQYCRVMRVQRDIPTYQTTAGVDKTNLRQYVNKLMEKKGIRSNDIRSRESGRQIVAGKNAKLSVLEYSASCGTEFFIQIEDEKSDTLYGFCRLRFPNESLRKEITTDSSIIRELHVYGKAVSIGEEDVNSSQHKGYGKQLLEMAEKITKEHGKTKVVVISGVGVREYYRKLGYSDDGPYVSKLL